MKIRRPRTLLGLVLLGLAFVTLPLLIAIGNAVIKLGQLATESETVLGDSATATLENQKLQTLLNSMERNARQYLLLQQDVANAQDFLNFYDGDLMDFEASLGLLSQLPRDAAISEQLEKLSMLSKSTHDTLHAPRTNGTLSQVIDNFRVMNLAARDVARRC